MPEGEATSLPPPERTVRAFQWKLGLLRGTPAEAEARDDWGRIAAWLRGDPARGDELVRQMLEPLAEVLVCGLGLREPKGNPQAARERWHGFLRYLATPKAAGELPRMMASKADECLRRAVRPAPPRPPAAPPAPVTADPTPPETESPSMTPQWKHLPLPDGPDRHDESDARAARSPEGFSLLGARVRGKKHKHEGTHCDDWFDFAAAGAWTFVAVADGAGSKKFSRVGARASTEAAVRQLAADLGGHAVRARETWSNDTFRRDEVEGVYVYAEEDLERVQAALHRAMLAAYFAVEKAAAERAASRDHERALGRKPEINDLSATLLLAAHTTVAYKGRDYSLILACQVGDGMTAAVDLDGKLQLLGEADSGDYSGETDFLTSQKKLERANLSRKTYAFFRPLRALLVMTDGVADDYFPNDPGMLRLYDDLKANGVLGAADAAGRLRDWLDTYQVRGSFDDRTLVALHREQAP